MDSEIQDLLFELFLLAAGGAAAGAAGQLPSAAAVRGIAEQVTGHSNSYVTPPSGLGVVTTRSVRPSGRYHSCWRGSSAR